MGKNVSVLVVEDSVLQQKGIRSEIAAFQNSRYDFEVRLQIRNAQNALMCCSKDDIDLVLMDVYTEGDATGIEVARELKSQFPQIKIIMMTGTLEGECLLMSRAIGCESFWQKDSSHPSLQEIMELTMDGNGYYPVELPTVFIGNSKNTEFSQKELDILREIAVLDSHKLVADRMGISINTLKYHLKVIREKTGLTSTIQVVSEAIHKQVIIPRVTKGE